MDNVSTARLHRAVFGLAASILCVSIAGADPLNPNGFVSLGDFPTTPGVYAINSDNATIVGPTGTINGVISNGIAVFTFQNIQIVLSELLPLSSSRTRRIESLNIAWSSSKP